MTKLWTETKPKKQWQRTDGATVYEVSLYCFEATGPEGEPFRTSRGAARTWTSPESAMAKVDAESPVDPILDPGADWGPGCPSCGGTLYEATQLGQKTRRWRCSDTSDCGMTYTDKALRTEGVVLENPEQRTADPATGRDSKHTPAAAVDPPKPYAELVADAAAAVRTAVIEHQGRVRPVHAWKPVAAVILQVSKLFKKRWQGVLDHGVEHGLFRIDKETYSYPVLVPLEPGALEPKTEMEAEPENEEAAPPSAPPQILPIPENWNPPTFMSCGHLDGYANEDGTCQGCIAKRAPSWRHLRGEFIRPIPTGLRRTREKENTKGYPGLCCNTEGLYIGGIFNDCRRTGDARCEVHA